MRKGDRMLVNEDKLGQRFTGGYTIRVGASENDFGVNSSSKQGCSGANFVQEEN